jgi:hypothetical protein
MTIIWERHLLRMLLRATGFGCLRDLPFPLSSENPSTRGGDVRMKLSDAGPYVCLAALERSSSGDFGYETGGALGAGGGQRSEDLPGSRAFWGFVTT